MVLRALLALLVSPGSAQVLNTSSVPWDAVRLDISNLLINPLWDDGSYAPILIRLAWHSSATYSRYDNTGGSNGASMRFSPELEDPGNAGLENARDLLQPIYNKYAHMGLSYSDLWIFAAYVSLEATAGPKLEFVPGRVDANQGLTVPSRLPDAERGLADGVEVDAQGRMQGWENLAAHIREVFDRLGFDDRETVALISGGHAYGRCHKEFTGYEGNWINHPFYFANEYVADMIDDTWTLIKKETPVPTAFPENGGFAPEDMRPDMGKRQFIDLTTMNPFALKTGMRQDDLQVSAGFARGRYTVATTWMNVRAGPETDSALLAKVPTGTTFTVVELQNVTSPEGLSVRGLTLEGGWITVNKGDPLYFDFVGGLDAHGLEGWYRSLDAGKEYECRKVYIDEDGTIKCRADGGDRKLLYSPRDGLVAERMMTDYNLQATRVPIKDQFGHQMMLPSDLVLKWDPGFRQALDLYYEDEELLKEDFAKAFKRLTELGCPWSSKEDVHEVSV